VRQHSESDKKNGKETFISVPQNHCLISWGNGFAYAKVSLSWGYAKVHQQTVHLFSSYFM
jgi:hypothetical protein